MTAPTAIAPPNASSSSSTKVNAAPWMSAVPTQGNGERHPQRRRGPAPRPRAAGRRRRPATVRRVTADRADAVARDASDPLRRFRERFVVADDELIYLDGNSLG